MSGSRLEQAAEALRECADRVDGLYSIGCEAVCSTSTGEETDRLIEKANAIIDRAHAALARIAAEPSACPCGNPQCHERPDAIAEAERRGYATCQADVVAWMHAETFKFEHEARYVLRNRVEGGEHVGAAARAKEKA